ncbi:Fc.00g079620.m01.CDS01 [Cosmosporella sp. VM-42]
MTVSPALSGAEERRQPEEDETGSLLETSHNSAEGSGYEACTQTESCDELKSTGGNKSIYGILSVLLIGVFVSQTDTFLVLAAYGSITTEFSGLQNASWLLSSYMLAMCVGQPLYGKLSDIFSRKTMLQTSYVFFSVGSVMCGLGTSMPHVILGRVIQGLGGAGMVCLVSIVIMDLVPLREVATYRSYVNIVQTLGRSSGGVIGGLLTQTIGWRWAFLCQAPLTMIAIVLVTWKLPTVKQASKQGSIRASLKRVDFAGATSMSCMIFCLLLVLDMGGDKVPWDSPTIISLTVLGTLFGVLFWAAEKYWAAEPVFPLHLLLSRDVVLCYSVMMLSTAAMAGMVMFVPLYFQVTKNASPATAGASLIPSVLGNTVGALLTSSYIKRTGQYKLPAILSGLCSSVTYTTLLVWWHGSTPTWQMAFVFPCGLGIGLAHAALFVALASTVKETDLAIAGSGYYLCGNVGAVAGLSATTTLFRAALKINLGISLGGIEHGSEIADKAMENLEYVKSLSGLMRELVIKAYVSSFQVTYLLLIVFAAMSVLGALMMREKRLK